VFVTSGGIHRGNSLEAVGEIRHRGGDHLSYPRANFGNIGKIWGFCGTEVPLQNSYPWCDFLQMLSSKTDIRRKQLFQSLHVSVRKSDRNTDNNSSRFSQALQHI